MSINVFPSVLVSDALPEQTNHSGHFLSTDGENLEWSAVIGEGTGDISGPAVAVNNNLVSFDETTGKLVKDSGYSPSSFEPADATILKDADIGVSIAAQSHSHSYEPANSNIQSHISNTSNPHSATISQVMSGITEVTDSPDGLNDYMPFYDASASAWKYIKINNFAKRSKSIFIAAGAFIPSTTSGCAYATIAESSTNKQNIAYLDFSPTAIQYAETTFLMPDFWSGGTITAKFVWTATGGSATAVRWGIAGRSYGDNELIDQALGTAVTVDDTWQTDLAVHHSPVSDAITIGGTPAGGELVQLRVYREGSASADTLAVNARLLGVILKYDVNKWGE